MSKEEKEGLCLWFNFPARLRDTATVFVDMRRIVAMNCALEASEGSFLRMDNL